MNFKQLSLSILMIIPLVSCAPNAPTGDKKVTSVTLNKETLNLEVGGSESLTATVLPNDATITKVSWISSLASVASVDNGLVTAIGEGEANITAYVDENNNGSLDSDEKSAVCVATITDSTADTKKVTVTFDNLETTINFDSATDPQKEYFMSLFNTAENEDLVKSFTSSKMYLDKQTDYVTLRLGSSSSNGELSMKFNHKITEVKANVEAYYKYIEYTDTWNIATEAKFYVNTDDNMIDLSVTDTTKRPGAKDYELSFTAGDNITELKFYTEQRVYVHSLEISYIQ